MGGGTRGIDHSLFIGTGLREGVGKVRLLRHFLMIKIVMEWISL
jgi:hypothetical protein